MPIKWLRSSELVSASASLSAAGYLHLHLYLVLVLHLHLRSTGFPSLSGLFLSRFVPSKLWAIIVNLQCTWQNDLAPRAVRTL